MLFLRYVSILAEKTDKLTEMHGISARGKVIKQVGVFHYKRTVYKVKILNRVACL